VRGYAYAQTGAYFVPICIFGRSRYFGEIIDAVMNWSEIGKIAEHEWIVIPQICPFMQIEMDAFVVMPTIFMAYSSSASIRPNRREAMRRVPPNSAQQSPELGQ
jgi:hypothetical protein